MLTIYQPAKVEGNVYEIPGRRLHGRGLRGMWELGCGGPAWEDADGVVHKSDFIPQDTVFLEPYTVVRRDLRCTDASMTPS